MSEEMEEQTPAEGEEAEGMGMPSTQAPAGFTRRTQISEANWVENETGNVCYGKLQGRYKMNVEPARWYYQIELLAPCKVREGTGDDAQLIVAQPGDVVNLNENHKTKCLRDIEIPEIAAGARYHVHVTYQNKIKISGGRTMWNVEVNTKQVKRPTSPVRSLPTEEDSGEETPF